MTASRAAEIEAEAIHSVIPDAEIIRIPLADGGDGTVQTLTTALHGTLRKVAVHDPLGRPIETVYGIAGGLGFGLRVFCGAKTESGAQLAIAMTGLEKELADADFLITGEGCTDSQTGKGKLCSELLALCLKHKVPCILLSGTVKEGVSAQKNGFVQVWSASDPSIPFAVVKPHAEEYLREAALKVAGKLSVR